MSRNFLFVLLLLCLSGCKSFNAPDTDESKNNYTYEAGAITRGDSTKKEIALVFTGDQYAEGGEVILQTLTEQNTKAAFFFTGHFYRNPAFSGLLTSLKEKGHYLGAHSDQHLLYCDWSKRDSLLVTKTEFTKDLLDNYREMEKFGIEKEDAPYFLPPYEWYNDSISRWTRSLNLQLINLTHGTLSHTDYTTPTMSAFRSSKEIYQSILEYEAAHPNGLNGFILLSHIGAGPERTDKFYLLLDELMKELKARGYSFVRIDELLE